jgi:hypothetical protein
MKEELGLADVQAADKARPPTFGLGAPSPRPTRPCPFVQLRCAGCRPRRRPEDGRAT